MFVTEREGPMTPATARKLIARAGELANSPVHPHMLRHACEYKLASERPGHARDPAVPGAQEHHAHGALHGVRVRRGSRAFGKIERRRRPT